ncbi:hypothetical protein DOY81_000915, partial [Sarcophaga bullata]
FGGGQSGGGYNNFSVPPPNFQMSESGNSGPFSKPPPSFSKPGGYDPGNRGGSGGSGWQDRGSSGGGYGNGGGNKDNYNKGSGGSGYGGNSGDLITQEDTIFVSGMDPESTEMDIETHFGAIGIIKKDKRTSKPKIWLYRHKDTGISKGEATVTYDDINAAQSAIDWFDGRDFNGCIIKVSLAQRPNNWSKGGGGVRGGSGGGGFGRGRGGGGQGGDRPRFDRGGGGGGDYDSGRGDRGDDRGSRPRMGGSGGGGPGSNNNVAPREGDWKCSSCNNTNFAWRNECNRCKTPKSGDESGNSRGGGGYGGDRGGYNRDNRGGGGFGGGNRFGGGGGRGGGGGGDRGGRRDYSGNNNGSNGGPMRNNPSNRSRPY